MSDLLRNLDSDLLVVEDEADAAEDFAERHYDELTPEEAAEARADFELLFTGKLMTAPFEDILAAQSRAGLGVHKISSCGDDGQVLGLMAVVSVPDVARQIAAILADAGSDVCLPHTDEDGEGTYEGLFRKTTPCVYRAKAVDGRLVAIMFIARDSAPTMVAKLKAVLGAYDPTVEADEEADHGE